MGHKDSGRIFLIIFFVRLLLDSLEIFVYSRGRLNASRHLQPFTLQVLTWLILPILPLYSYLSLFTCFSWQRKNKICAEFKSSCRLRPSTRMDSYFGDIYNQLANVWRRSAELKGLRFHRYNQTLNRSSFAAQTERKFASSTTILK